MRAAQALEGVLIDEYPGDDRTEELLYVLSLYSPGNGVPYSEASDIRPLLLSTLESLAYEALSQRLRCTVRDRLPGQLT